MQLKHTVLYERRGCLGTDAAGLGKHFTKNQVVWVLLACYHEKANITETVELGVLVP